MTSTRYLGFACVVLVGCGKVATKEQPSPVDAPGAQCDDPTSVDSCGAACERCLADGDRKVATCDGTACGTTCRDGAPICSDGSCTRLAWSFDTGTLDGIAPRAPADLALAVRDFAGDTALAIDTTNLVEVSFTVPICVSGSADFRNRTLSALVFFQGDAPTGEQFYVQASVPEPVTNGFLTFQGVAANIWTPIKSPLGMSAFSGTTTTVTFQAGTFGAPFSGTIWFDNIEIAAN